MREWLGQRKGTVILGVVFAIAISTNRIANFITDYWWFDALRHADVFTSVLWARLQLAAMFGGTLAILIAVNLTIVRRIRPLYVPSSPQQVAIERYRNVINPYLPWVIAGVSLLFGLSAGNFASLQWPQWLLFLEGAAFGVTDPQFGTDVGFYVFELPWWLLVQQWLFASLVLTFALTFGGHLLLGGIRPDLPGQRLTTKVKAHLSVIAVLALAVRAWGYWLDRYLLTYSERGGVTGASFTDVNAELPALYALIGLSAIAIALVLASVRREGFLLPTAAIGVLVIGTILLQGAYPELVQRLRVDPQPLEREREFISRNQDATLASYGLAAIETQELEVGAGFDQSALTAEAATLDNVPIWDSGTLLTAYQKVQQRLPYYEFVDVDTDRYQINGETRQVMLASREINPTGADANWQNRRLTFTHGLGVVSSLISTATTDGDPEYVARGLPPRAVAPLEIDLDEGGIYYGESRFFGRGVLDYAIANTAQPEVHYERINTNIPDEADATDIDAVAVEQAQIDDLLGDPSDAPDGDLGDAPAEDPDAESDADDGAVEPELEETDPTKRVTIAYDGDGGVRASSIWRRLAFAIRFREANFVLSSLIEEDSRVMFNRNISGRVLELAPYLTLDSDPYPVVLDGRVLWVQDAYTTSALYPYAELVNFNGRRTNYVRNSVKAVVDAFDGSVTLYVVDDEDPIAAAWSRVFPDLYAPVAEAPEGLVAHFRYPRDLFEVQTAIYGRYHLDDVDEFFEAGDRWTIPTASATGLTAGAPFAPQHILLQLPGEDEPEFVLMRPYRVPGNNPLMPSIMVARSDPENYGQLKSYVLDGRDVPSPELASDEIENDAEVIKYIEDRTQEEGSVRRGTLVVLPVADTVLYVQPLYLVNAQDIPDLSQVTVLQGSKVVMNATLEGALQEIVGVEQEEFLGEGPRQQPTTPTPTPQPTPTDPDAPSPVFEGDVAELLREASLAFEAADRALAAGDLGRYQDEIARARALIEQAELFGSGEAASEPAPQPAPSESETPEGEPAAA